MEELENKHSRFKAATWLPNREEPVMVAGCGGTGSFVTFLLSRAGFKPFVYDDDIIEEHNLSGQFFKTTDINKYKVNAISDIIHEFNGEYIDHHNTKIDENSITHHFIFSCFDNMSARKILFESWEKNIENTTIIPILIDLRLEYEQLQIYCVTPNRIKEYKETLFDDSVIPDAPCTLKQTTHSAAMIASIAVSFFTNHITNIYERQKVRSVPFYYEQFLPLALTTIKE